MSNELDTELQIKFWSSNHVCNIMKAEVAVSLDEASYIQSAKRGGYTRAWRNRVWAAYGQYVNIPDMVGIPFSEIEEEWWNDMPNIELPSDKFTTLVPGPTPVYVEPVPNPVLTLLPIDVVDVEGATAVLTADATGYDTVEWFEGHVSKGITTTLNVPVLNDGITHDYIVVFSIEDAEYGTRRSTSASASVVGTSGVPVITLQPVGGNGDEVAGFALTSLGTGHSSIQWQSQNAYLLWTDIVGATTADLIYIAPYTGRYVPLRAQYINTFGITTTQEAQVYLAKV